MRITDSQLHIPSDIADAARAIGRWADEHDFKDWQPGPCADRNMIAALRERAEKAEARVKSLEATIAGYERHSYGWPKYDAENTYRDAEEYASECELEHGVTFEWEVAAVLRTERYRVVEHRDEEGNWVSTTAELVTEPLPAKEGTDANH